MYDYSTNVYVYYGDWILMQQRIYEGWLHIQSLWLVKRWKEWLYRKVIISSYRPTIRVNLSRNDTRWSVLRWKSTT